MKRSLLVWAGVCVFAFLPAVAVIATVADSNPATKPVPRLEIKSWKARHESFVKRAKAGDVDVLFLGDSITQGWEGNGKNTWETNFAALKAANFGIGGDRTQHVLWRITEGKELDGIDPKVAVLMIGTNNISSDTADQIADGVAAIVSELRKQKPNTKVLLLGVFPRSGKPAKSLKDATVVAPDELQPKVKSINERIAKLADGKMVTFLDIGAKLLNKNGGLPKEIMPDFLHLSPKGYEIWAAAIKPPVERMLKE